MQKLNPKAWMPLPEPYKAESEEICGTDMRTNRKNCEYRHENGNCLKVGGFCTSVDDEHCVKNDSEEISERNMKMWEEIFKSESGAGNEVN